MALHDDYNVAFEANDAETKNHITSGTEDRATEALSEQARHIRRGYLDAGLENKLITKEQMQELGIHLRDEIPTSVAEPTSRSLLSKVQALGGFAVSFHFHDEHIEHSQAVLPGCNGCLVNYHYGPEKVLDVTQLEQTHLFTASPARLVLPPDAEGQWLSLSSRWQLDKGGILGQPGPIEYVRVT
jgi:hypothetical protein